MKLEEKRRFPRITFKAPIHYQVRGRSEFSNAVSSDLSLGGLNFVTDKFIAPRTSVGLEVDVLSRILSPIGRVAWLSPLAHSDRYKVGVEFLEFDPPEKVYLNDYLDMMPGKFV